MHNVRARNHTLTRMRIRTRTLTRTRVHTSVCIQWHARKYVRAPRIHNLAHTHTRAPPPPPGHAHAHPHTHSRTHTYARTYPRSHCTHILNTYYYYAYIIQNYAYHFIVMIIKQHLLW